VVFRKGYEFGCGEAHVTADEDDGVEGGQAVHQAAARRVYEVVEAAFRPFGCLLTDLHFHVFAITLNLNNFNAGDAKRFRVKVTPIRIHVITLNRPK
jgi:hypothetical protein